ncbi:hypothetical protein BDW59DRAFT_105863 [Aspergillus cavernicola]|uniref:Uncharacterized protein n=1 Tax=Aspergillus cavernicola TaxID=176166 RepID=A0ABR4IYA4_9EURO
MILYREPEHRYVLPQIQYIPLNYSTSSSGGLSNSQFQLLLLQLRQQLQIPRPIKTGQLATTTTNNHENSSGSVAATEPYYVNILRVQRAFSRDGEIVVSCSNGASQGGDRYT